MASINVLLNVNIPEMENDTVDNFENYFGLDTLLNDSWAINKDSGCELSLSNTNEKVGNGSYALRFEYKETKNGWAGAVCSRTVDYSSYNALQMWIVPDGKNQKTVIQINTADGGSYEAYLNTYEDYVDIKDKPIRVTVPFNEFVDKGNRGALTSKAAKDITGFALFINAIPDSKAIDENGQVSGVLYFDEIKAVKYNGTGVFVE